MQANYTGFSVLRTVLIGQKNRSSNFHNLDKILYQRRLYIFFVLIIFFNVIISGCCQVMPKVRIATTGLFVTLPVIRLETKRPRAPAVGTEQDLQIIQIMAKVIYNGVFSTDRVHLELLARSVRRTWTTYSFIST